MKKAILALALILPISAADTSWQPAKVAITSEFGAKVNPANAWNIYPRPRLVRGGWSCLNGLWTYAITPKDAGKPAGWNGSILVPFALESSLSGVGRLLEPHEALWYRRSIPTPPLPSGHRRILRFEGVDWDARVEVNGIEVGGNRGMNRRWSCDITEATAGRTDSEIIVRVLDATTGIQPHGKQSFEPKGCFYTRVSGIWQTVWMETVPDNHVIGILTESLPSLDGVSVRVEASTPECNLMVRMLHQGKVMATASGKSDVPLELKPPQPQLWSPDAPHLYDLEITLDGGETVKSYTAIRSCEVKPDSHGTPRMHLNGRPLFQYGPLDQGWWPESLLTPPSEAAQRWELDFLKRSGFNMLRKHLKVENDLYYRACDEIGLLVWQDFPFPGDRKTEEGRQVFRDESASILEQLRGFPSIVTWVVFNEMWEQFDEKGTKEMAAWTKHTDPARIVNSASGWMDYGAGDLVDAHRYPGPGIPALDPVRAAVLGEFGGQGLAVPGHMWKQESWGYKDSPDPDSLAKTYAGFMEKLRPLITRGLSAAVYTQTTDVEIEKNGLLSYDRKVMKIAPDRLEDLHAPLYRDEPPFRVIAPTAELKPVAWRYTTTKPAEGWTIPDFQDTAWTRGDAGFGKVTIKYTSGMTRIRTVWDSGEIWLRRSFRFDGPDAINPALVIYADHKTDVWLNGSQIATGIERNNAGSYTIVPLDSLPLQKGNNTLAVHCRRQTKDNQYIDVGIIDLHQPKQPHP